MVSGMTRLYFDNAATSFPKPPVVAEAMHDYMTRLGASPGRGAYAEAVESGRLLQDCRDAINTLINGASGDHVIFTLNTSDALNLAIKGVVAHHRRRGEPVHVVTTWMDHNSILRPYNALAADGVEQTRVEVDPATGLVDPAAVRAALRPDTRLVATNHASNVTGTVQPVADIGAVCAAAGVPFLVDGAQTAGHMPLDVQAMHIDLLAFPGHKGLLGPLGTGGLYIRPGLEDRLDPLREGGTGSASESDRQPQDMPDKFEPGSHNAVGIVGLGAAVRWILDRGVEALWAHEQSCMRIVLDGLRDLPGLRLLGPSTPEHRVGVFAVVMDDLAPEALAAILEDRYGILTRAGLHCAPLAHRTMSTHETGGATRLSLGPFLSEADTTRAVDALTEIARAPVATA
jgi:cysteine desulfurase family protein